MIRPQRDAASTAGSGSTGPAWNGPPRGAVAAPLATGLGCALLAAAFGWASGWSWAALAGGYVLGGMFGVLAGGLAVLVIARSR